MYKHNRDRLTYFSGCRVSKLNFRMGTMCLLVPKVRPNILGDKEEMERGSVAEAGTVGLSKRGIDTED